MLKCTYIILIDNNEDNITYLIDSLKKIKGDFKKEFIIVDDGSKDDSLKFLRNAVNELPRTTIITQNPQGPIISINKALSLSTGDYIHFISGDETLHPDSTSIMINACIEFGVEVACGNYIENNQLPKMQKILPKYRLITNPIHEILTTKIKSISNIGSSASLITRNLLAKIQIVDSRIYSHTMLMSLKCAKYSKFILIDNVLTYKKSANFIQDPSFETYNNLIAIYNFAVQNQEISNVLNKDLLKRLSLENLSPKSKILYFLKTLSHKPVKLQDILQFYEKELEKLF